MNQYSERYIWFVQQSLFSYWLFLQCCVTEQQNMLYCSTLKLFLLMSLRLTNHGDEKAPHWSGHSQSTSDSDRRGYGRWRWQCAAVISGTLVTGSGANVWYADGVKRTISSSRWLCWKNCAAVQCGRLQVPFQNESWNVPGSPPNQYTLHNLCSKIVCFSNIKSNISNISLSEICAVFKLN